MTTAHRPTWVSAVGAVKNYGFTSTHVSAKDQNGETRLKFRQVGQSSKSEMDRRDLMEELEKKEYEHLSEKNKLIAMIENEERKIDAVPLLKERGELADPDVGSSYNDADIDTSGQNRQDDDDDEFDSSSDEDDDEDDDELELQRELEKIKAERAEAKARQEAEARRAEEESSRESALLGNPLLNLSASGSSEKVKRKWNDDVVFRHQTRSEPETKKRFVNDTIRNDFHRSFLKKYIQ